MSKRTSLLNTGVIESKGKGLGGGWGGVGVGGGGGQVQTVIIKGLSQAES